MSGAEARREGNWQSVPCPEMEGGRIQEGQTTLYVQFEEIKRKMGEFGAGERQGNSKF